MDIRCCPKMSRDANGSTGTIGMKVFLNAAGICLSHTVLKLDEGEE